MFTTSTVAVIKCKLCWGEISVVRPYWLVWDYTRGSVVIPPYDPVCDLNDAL